MSLLTDFDTPQPVYMVAQEPKDAMQAVISDTHSGSNFALFLNRHWHGQKTSHIPRAVQIKIRDQMEKYTDEVRQAREGKKMILVHNGDAIDGDHHHSGDVATLDEVEQADIHIELMEEIKTRMDWQRGNEIYYTRGTQSHVHGMENYIGRQMNAVPCGDFHVWDFLELETNGVMSWFVHHGPGRGKGANEGNPIRNWLKNIYYDAMKDNIRCPDIVYTGHVHDPGYDVFPRRKKMVFSLMHGIILPSWQAKTSYAWMKAPVSKNKIGGVYHEIKSDGTITVPKFSIMATD